MKALFTLVDRRWLSPPHARMQDLKRLAAQGYATQCGRLFHPTVLADNAVADMRKPSSQMEMFA